MLARRLAGRPRNSDLPPEPVAAEPPLLFKHPGARAVIQPVIFGLTEVHTSFTWSGYTVILYSEVERRTFIVKHYTDQLVSLYDQLPPSGKLELWSAAILYKYGGICLLDDIVDLADLTVESTTVGGVTVATIGSEVMKEHILQMFLPRKVWPAKVYRPVRIYILCHTEERFESAKSIYGAYSWAVPIRMKYQDFTFENAFWKQLEEIKEEWASCKFVGTLSYTAYKKLSLASIHKIIQSQLHLKSDYYHFFETNNTIKNYHPHINTIIQDVVSTLRIPVPTAAHCNYWMCSPSRMVGFLRWYDTILKPTVTAHPLIKTDAEYRGALTPAELQILCGLPYYPHAPFVLERLTSCYFKQLKTIKSRVFLIGGVDAGGSLKFIHDFIRMLPDTQRITTKSVLQKTQFTMNDILVIQHLVADITPTLLCSIQTATNCRLIMNIHDFWWFDALHPHKKYLDKDISIKPDIRQLFAAAELIIHPSQFTYDVYRQYFPCENFYISPHIDYVQMDSILVIPPVRGSLVIGCMHNFSEYKGREYILYLIEQFKTYKGFTVEFKIAGHNIPEYNENEFFDIIRQQGLHCLLLLNKWGETYCYSLSKFLKAGLPILYNAIGAPTERIPDRPAYQKAFYSVIAFDDNDKSLLCQKFTNMLDFIIEQQGAGGPPLQPVSLHLELPPLYDYIFNSVANSTIMNKIYTKIKPFGIYFPQFHQLVENDYNYYTGMTDMKNLISYLSDTANPHFDSSALCCLEDYDLSKRELVLQQVEQAKAHGLYGFCVYYYWFSHNNLSQCHSIMDTCYNHFFDESMGGFKIYFNWANEDWTKNPAFTSDSSVNISNIYTEKNIRKNFNNLAKYFVHSNYYKIDNAPVFGIHHPWFITSTELTLVERIFTEECIAIGFSGIHIIKNSMVQQYDNSFLAAPNYKIERSSTDYVTYIPTTIDSSTIHTMFFSFDNTVRMYKSKNPDIYKITNAVPEQQLKLLTALIGSYKMSGRSELQKLFLINSWNEWGEDMAIEPSVKKGTFYLDMLKRSFLNVLL